ncbi:beta-ketoacyl synthase N-terminal-like domain-containing protein [Flavobacterium sp. LT1R49]|uniref:beta-ketoacyl synthase N-terminal-like domain-containing protein n=1 Tax=Flavobacterium arabinosi TaxID=3398737 RepID=UPI003A8C176F
MKRVVITGLGTINPVGKDVATFWKNSLEGKSSTGIITRFDASKFRTQIAAEIKDFDFPESIGLFFVKSCIKRKNSSKNYNF